MDYKLIKMLDHSGELINRKYHIKLEYYTKRQMKRIYPIMNFRVVGEIGNRTGIQCGAVENLDGNSLPVYKEKTHNILTESIAGYAAVDDHTYLAVVKNIILSRVLLFLLVILFSFAGAILLYFI